MHGGAHDERRQHQRRRGDDDERRGDSERADEHGGQRRAGGEPGDVGGEQPAEVVPEVGGVGDDDDPADRRHGHPGGDARDEAAGEQRRRTVVDAAITSRPATLSTRADDDQGAGVPAVGERGDRHLGDEPGDEADPDDGAERRLADAVLVAHVVEQGEQHAVAGGEEGADEPQHDERPAGTHQVTVDAEKSD